MAALVLPFGAATAGERLGASRLGRAFGSAAKVWNGDDPGQFIIGGVPIVAFSMTDKGQRSGQTRDFSF